MEAQTVSLQEMQQLQEKHQEEMQYMYERVHELEQVLLKRKLIYDIEEDVLSYLLMDINNPCEKEEIRKLGKNNISGILEYCRQQVEYYKQQEGSRQQEEFQQQEEQQKNKTCKSILKKVRYNPYAGRSGMVVCQGVPLHLEEFYSFRRETYSQLIQFQRSIQKMSTSFERAEALQSEHLQAYIDARFCHRRPSTVLTPGEQAYSYAEIVKKSYIENTSQ